MYMLIHISIHFEGTGISQGAPVAQNEGASDVRHVDEVAEISTAALDDQREACDAYVDMNHRCGRGYVM